MGQAAARLIGGLHGYWNPSREQDTGREASSSSAPLALVSVGMQINPSEAGGYEVPDSAYSRRQFLLELAEVLPHFITSRRSRNGGGGGVPRALIELLLLRWCRDYELEALDYDLEAGGARRTGGGAATPVQEVSEVAKVLQGVMVQAYAAFLPACVTAYPLLMDAPEYVKLTIFGGLAFVTVGLFFGILSTSVARRGLAVRLVSFSAIAVLTFSVASQLSSRAYIAVTALVGVMANLIIMLLPF